jgi:hypothetical protein
VGHFHIFQPVPPLIISALAPESWDTCPGLSGIGLHVHAQLRAPLQTSNVHTPHEHLRTVNDAYEHLSPLLRDVVSHNRRRLARIARLLERSPAEPAVKPFLTRRVEIKTRNAQ